MNTWSVFESSQNFAWEIQHKIKLVLFVDLNSRRSCKGDSVDDDKVWILLNRKLSVSEGRKVMD